MENSRRTLTAEERREFKEIEKTLKVSSYLDDVFEAIHAGGPPKVKVPNFRQPTKGEVLASVHSDTPLPCESESIMSMNLDELYQAGVDIGSIEESRPAADVQQPLMKTASDNARTITQNQWKAIQKYPGVVEFLGQDHGEDLAKQITAQVNVALSEIIHSNSHEANANAVTCTADKQNLKQYFQGDNWVCRVTASGPFRGDEAIVYSREKDVAGILRKSNSGDEVKYTDVSSNFNVIFEASTVEVDVESSKVEVEAQKENTDEIVDTDNMSNSD